MTVDASKVERKVSSGCLLQDMTTHLALLPVLQCHNKVQYAVV